jgi:hypothetical protein
VTQNEECSQLSKEATSPSTTLDVGPVAIETFAGSVALSGSAFYSFSSARDGTLSLTLLKLDDADGPSSASMLLSIGYPSGTGCTIDTSTSAPVGTTAQLSNTYAAGVYCAKITDTGNLASPATFVINIVHPR